MCFPGLSLAPRRWLPDEPRRRRQATCQSKPHRMAGFCFPLRANSALLRRPAEFRARRRLQYCGRNHGSQRRGLKGDGAPKAAVRETPICRQFRRFRGNTAPRPEDRGGRSTGLPAAGHLQLPPRPAGRLSALIGLMRARETEGKSTTAQLAAMGRMARELGSLAPQVSARPRAAMTTSASPMRLTTPLSDRSISPCFGFQGGQCLTIVAIILYRLSSETAFASRGADAWFGRIDSGKLVSRQSAGHRFAQCQTARYDRRKYEACGG